jgi:hypothetical protein
MKQYIITRLKNGVPEIIGFEVVIGNETFHQLRKIKLSKTCRKPGEFPKLPGDTKEEVK